MNKVNSYTGNTVLNYTIAFSIGIIVGFRISPPIVGMLYIILSVVCIYLAFQNNFKTLLSVLPYLMYTEMFIRAFFRTIPYLYLQYFFIAAFSILILKNWAMLRVHSKAFSFLFFFILIELISSSRSTSPDVARGLVINSVVIAVVVLWASCNYISPFSANRILNHIKYASVYLCGIAMTEYLTGGAAFSDHSSINGTNGLAPVQISGYLGFSSVIFFFSIMNERGTKNLILNIAMLSLNVIVILFSFSRGGIYFLGITMALYFIFNCRAVKSYFLFLLLIPVGLLVYSYTSHRTNGLIGERYAQEGASGRGDLAKAGWTLFLSNPLSGIGTGNFNEAITKNDLYNTESGAHNEFIRVAAEDGILGIITYCGFFLFLFIEIMKRNKIPREYGTYFLLFFCLVTIHNGLKISLQPFLMILAIATPTMAYVKKKKNGSFKNQPSIRYSTNCSVS